MPPEGTIGVLISLFVESSGGGLSLADLIQRVEKQMAGNAELVLKLLSTVAETLGNATTAAMMMKFDEHLARSSLQVFDLSRVPAIREDIPSELSQVRFRSDLSRLAPADVRELWARSKRTRDLLPGDA